MTHDRPSLTTNTAEAKRHLDDFGYAIHAEALSPTEIAALRDRLVEQAELEQEAKGQAAAAAPVRFKVVDFLVNKGRVFIDLALHPLISEYTRHVLAGTQSHLYSQLGYIVGKGNPQGVVHTDSQSLGFRTPMATGLNCMACLTDFEEANGATLLEPRSHLRPLPRHEPTSEGLGTRAVDPVELVPAEAPAGSLIMWESRTWHSTGASTSETMRHSVSTLYTVFWLAPQNLYAAGLHDDVYRTLSNEELNRIGFASWNHLVNRFGPRSPDDERSNSNGDVPYVPELRRAHDGS